MKRIPCIVPVLAAACLLAGCAYKLEGKVVEGFGGYVVSDPQDPDCSKPGVSGASVELVRDASTMNREVCGRATSRADGRFTIEVKGFGAGWMEEQWQLRVRRSGYENVFGEVDLPSSSDGRMLVVTMRRGKSAPFKEPESSKRLMDEAREWYPGAGNGGAK